MKKILFTVLFLGFGLVFIAIADTVRCSVCGTRCAGTYIKGGNRNFCSQKCLDTILPRCAACGRTISGKFVKFDGKSYCSRGCARTIIPKCEVCGIPLEGKYHYIDVDAVRRKFCENCNGLPRCFVCGMPCRWKKFPDGRHLCGRCDRNCVTSSIDAERIFDGVRHRLESILRPGVRCSVPIYLVNQQDFDRVAGKTKIYRAPNSTLLGLFHWEESYRQYTDGRRESIRKTEGIYILSGIPKDRFMEVAAHELAHHWQQHHFPNVKDVKLKEGFAEYIASRINQLNGNPQLNLRMERNPDPVYGGGYRMVKEIVREKSWKGLLEILSVSK